MTKKNLNNFHKSGGWDKYDCHTPGKAHFIHDDYYVSMYNRQFHCAYNYYYPTEGNGPGFGAGVQKKLHKATGHGIMVDGHYVGRSDNE